METSDGKADVTCEFWDDYYPWTMEGGAHFIIIYGHVPNVEICSEVRPNCMYGERESVQNVAWLRFFKQNIRVYMPVYYNCPFPL